MLQPCRNNGTCNTTPTAQPGYNCLCPSGFNGTHCEIDQRLCKPNTCLHASRYSTLFSSTKNDPIFFSLQVHVMKHQIKHSIVHAIKDGKVLAVIQ